MGLYKRQVEIASPTDRKQVDYALFLRDLAGQLVTPFDSNFSKFVTEYFSSKLTLISN